MNHTTKAAVVAVMAAAAWLAWPSADIPAPVADTAAPPTPVVAAPATAGTPFFAPVPSSQPHISAAQSMAQSRLHGDPEAPPIANQPITRDPPSAQELADPKAYEAYEARQTQRTYAAYIRAVDEELPRLRADIERGRAMGIAPNKIAMAEDKARRLGLMRAQLAKELQAAP
ncbi:hypothetical protein [Massilia sp. CF038]|uniref:hypothetical protein n=1 Tax=Massilia sp. CF038 TaxID=1881045 RepID=UPI000921CDA6|nr:hypothetical protein [Massilia sp. CF038]SHH22794.1 hypothetical protein SAMN05428948_3412 [Massilia sp. CF038]